MIRIWTDGACSLNPGGSGGWAFVAVLNGVVIHQASGGASNTTNNRMEMLAVVEALQWLGNGRAEVYSDSQYVVKGINDWMHKWHARGWRLKKAKVQPPKNVDIWKTLYSLMRGSLVTVTWVRGHNGDRFNEMADKLAVAESRRIRKNSPEDFLRRHGL